MVKRDETDDLDLLIDRAVDTYLVEATSKAERAQQSPDSDSDSSHPGEVNDLPEKTRKGVSLDEAVDSLFTNSFELDIGQRVRTSTTVTSGDPEVDQAIDLAVDTLFVEEPETPPPETAQLRVADSPEEDSLDQYLGMERSYSDRVDFSGEAVPRPPSGKTGDTPEGQLAYDDVMALEIRRHLHTMYDDAAKAAPAAPDKVRQGTAAAAPSKRLGQDDALALRKLQEAILTLEWEVSKRSVTALATELQRVRVRFQEHVTVDFAAMSMRVVLDYVVKRMARAHPESIRFLLEVTDFLERILVSAGQDPLRSFHQILNRYERYKSTVRKAEGLPDRRPAILAELGIEDPDSFARMVGAHAATLIKASDSLANGLKLSRDPENLIRSFRFLVTRSFNRILEKTHKQKGKRETRNSNRPV